MTKNVSPPSLSTPLMIEKLENDFKFPISNPRYLIQWETLTCQIDIPINMQQSSLAAVYTAQVVRVIVFITT